MFPINANDSYIKENGKRSTIGAELNAGGGGGGTDLPDYSIADAGKVLTVGDDGDLEWHDAGGAGGVYVGITPPDASLGSNGEYYYQRDTHINWLKSLGADTNTSQLAYGNELKINKSCKITGVRAMLSTTKTGSVVIGTDTDVIETIPNLSFVADTWLDIPLSTPITCAKDDKIIVKIVLETSGGIRYTQTSSKLIANESIASYTNGRYGTTYPGTSDSAIIPISIVVEEPYYLVTNQYYKTDDTWVLLEG